MTEKGIHKKIYRNARHTACRIPRDGNSILDTTTHLYHRTLNQDNVLKITKFSWKALCTMDLIPIYLFT